MEENTDKKESVFKARAEKLAHVETERQAKKDLLELVVFTLSKERYALDSHFVREAYPMKGLTLVPCVPAFVTGVIHVRRKIYSIIDLRVLFGLSVGPAKNQGKVLILEKEKMAFGVLAEEVLGILKVAPEELQPPLPSLTGVHLEFVKGVTEDCVVVLDGEKLLNSTTLIVEESVETV